MQLPRWEAKIWRNYNGRLVLALVAGLVFPFAFAPHNLWPISILALLVLYQSIQHTNQSWRIIGLCFAFAIGKFGVGTYWILVSLVSYAEIHLLLTIGLFTAVLLITGVLFSLLGLFTAKSRIAILNALVFASGLVVVEILLSLPWPLSFPWLHLGYALIDTPISIFAPLGGVWAVSFVGAFTAAALSHILSQRWYAAVGAILFWIPGLFLPERLTDDGDSLTVALVQGNVPIEDKWQQDSWRESLTKYKRLTNVASSAELIVWPESALPVETNLVADDIVDTVQELDGQLVFGALESTKVGGSIETFNVVVAFDQSKFSYFRKEQLVPFGEYIPLRRVFGSVLRPLGYPMSNLQSSKASQHPLQLGSISLGSAICYESAYPLLVRKRGLDADVLVVLSEDSWLGDTTGPWQHLQIARMRALELNRPVLRATNDGVTASINAKGTVVRRLPRYQEDVLVDSVILQEGHTFFAKYGVLPISLLIVLVLLSQLVFKSFDSRRNT